MILTNYPNLKVVLIVIALIIPFIIIIIPTTMVSDLTAKFKKSKTVQTESTAIQSSTLTTAIFRYTTIFLGILLASSVVSSLCSSPCTTTQICMNNTCLGTGSLGISLFWSFEGDFDIYIQTPYGMSISGGYKLDASFYSDFGQIDATSETTGPENVFWNINYEPPWGMYHVCIVAGFYYDISVTNPLIATAHVRLPTKPTQVFTQTFVSNPYGGCDNQSEGYINSFNYP